MFLPVGPPPLPPVALIYLIVRIIGIFLKEQVRKSVKMTPSVILTTHHLIRHAGRDQTGRSLVVITNHHTNHSLSLSFDIINCCNQHPSQTVFLIYYKKCQFSMFLKHFIIEGLHCTVSNNKF